MSYEYMWMDSPIGKLRLVANKNGLAGNLWEIERVNLEPLFENMENAILKMQQCNLKTILKENERSLTSSWTSKELIFKRKSGMHC